MPFLRRNIYMSYWFLFDCCLVLRHSVDSTSNYTIS